MLRVKHLIKIGDLIMFQLYIEDQTEPVGVFYCRRNGLWDASRSDYEAEDYIRKAIRKIESLLPRLPRSFKMTWY